MSQEMVGVTFQVLQTVEVLQRLSSKANIQKLGMSFSRCYSIPTVSTRAGVNPKTLRFTGMELNDPGKPMLTQQGPQALRPVGVITGTY